jgi:hypothetical protein
MRKQAGKRPERRRPARLISKAHLLERSEREQAFDAAGVRREGDREGDREEDRKQARRG